MSSGSSTDKPDGTIEQLESTDGARPIPFEDVEGCDDEAHLLRDSLRTLSELLKEVANSDTIDLDTALGAMAEVQKQLVGLQSGDTKAAQLDTRVLPDTVTAMLESIKHLLSLVLANQPPEMLATLMVPILDIIAETNHLAAAQIRRIAKENGPFQIGGRTIGALHSGMKVLDEAVLDHAPEPELKAREQVVPSDRAYQIVLEAKKASIQRSKEKERRVKAIAETLHELISAKIKELHPETPDDKISTLYTYLESTFAQKYEKAIGVRLATIVREISADAFIKAMFNVQEEDLKEVFQDEGDTNQIARLRKEIKVEEGPSRGFRNLYAERVGNRNVAYSRAIRESIPPSEAGDTSGYLEELADKANTYAQRILPDFTLHSIVEATSDIDELMWLMKIVPASPDELHIFQSANAKLEIMYALHILETQTDIKYERAVIKQFARRLAMMVVPYSDGNMLVNPPTSEGAIIEDPEALETDENHLFINRYVIDWVCKTLESRIVKIILSDLKSAFSIMDRMRFLVYLTQEDSPTNPHTDPKVDEHMTNSDLAVIKLLGVLLSEFRDELYASRTKYTFMDGGTNSRSGGKHLGLHATLSYMHQSQRNRYARTGEPKAEVVPIEFQVLAFMNEDEARLDHDYYNQTRRQELKEKLGINLTFNDFVVDLMETIESRYDFGFRNLSTQEQFEATVDPVLREFHERSLGISDLDIIPEHVNIQHLLEHRKVNLDQNSEPIVLLFLDVLTRANDDGSALVNKATLEYLLNYHKGQLRKIINICKRWPGSRREGNPQIVELIRQKAKILEGLVNNAKQGFAPPKITSQIENDRSGNYYVATTSSFQNGYNVQSKQSYRGPIGMDSREISEDEVHYYEQFPQGARKKERLAYVVQRDMIEGEHVFRCYRVGEDPRERLLVWTAKPTPQADKFAFKIMSYNYARNPEDLSKAILQEVPYNRTKYYPIVPKPGNSVISLMKPSVALEGNNARFYEMIADLQQRQRS